MKLIYFVFILTLFRLTMSKEQLDTQLMCKSYTLMNNMKETVNATMFANRKLIDDLDSRVESSFSDLSKRMEKMESQNFDLKQNLSALQEAYNDLQLDLLDIISDRSAEMMAQNQTIEVNALQEEDKILESLKNTNALGPYGGNGGADFTDEEAALNGNITAVHFRTQFDRALNRTRLERFGFSYGHFLVLHGKPLGKEHIRTKNLLAGEFIVGLKGCTQHDSEGHTVIYELMFQTNQRKLTLFSGRPCTNGVSFGNMQVSPPYQKLAYISGKTGWLIDQLTFHFFNTFED